MPTTERLAELESLAELVSAARRDGIYESDPDWQLIDEALRELGYDPTPVA